MEGVAKKKAILDRYNELMMNYSDETADEATKLQDQIDARTSGTSTARSSMAMDALGCPPGDADVDQALGRREAPRRALPAAARAQPDLLLLDEPTNHLDAETVRVAGEAPARVSRARS